MLRTLAFAAAILFGATSIVSAQSNAANYPSRQIRLVVPFPPGGGSDAQGRILADALQRELGQNVVVDNVSGAGGTIGVSQVARAAPDGYTLLAASPSITINPHLQKEARYDPIRDFDPVIQTTTSPAVLVVPANSAIRSVQDLIDMARGRPGEIQYGTPGLGSFEHLGSELFASLTNVQLKHVPYRGVAAALLDLIAGRIHVQFENAPAILGQVRSGELRAVAVGTTGKYDMLPDLPTIAATVPGYEASSWFGIMVPAGTPRPVIDKLNAALDKILADSEVRTKLAALGVSIVGGSSDRFGEYIKAKVAEMAKLAATANLQPQ